MTTFDFLWQLLQSHGVIPNKKAEAAQLWNRYSLEQQREIYRSIRDHLREGKFVNYNPVIAIKNHTPRKRLPQQISYGEYYKRYGTDLEMDGWRRKFLPEERRTIYVKN